MVTKRQVELAADEVRCSNKRVSLRSIVPVLRKKWRGGSFREVGPLLAEWKVERNYQPRIELANLPEILSGKLATVGKEIWETALAEATERLNEERRKLDVERAEFRQVLDEALDLLDGANTRHSVLAGEAERLRTENARLGEENNRLRGELDEAEKRLQKVRANEFWDRVMREIYELMPKDGRGLKVAEIEPLVPRDLIGEAQGHVEGWSRDVLRKKLDTRVHWNRYFRREDARYFRREVTDADRAA
jgi:hypothetical protein